MQYGKNYLKRHWPFKLLQERVWVLVVQVELKFEVQGAKN